jgi:hypothetical protein
MKQNIGLCNRHSFAVPQHVCRKEWIYDSPKIVIIFSTWYNVNCSYMFKCRGGDSSVGRATGYRLDALGLESWWGQDFSYMSRPALGLTQSPVLYNGYQVFPAGKVVGAWSWPTPFWCRGQERVELYSPPGLRVCYEVTLPYFLCISIMFSHLFPSWNVFYLHIVYCLGYLPSFDLNCVITTVKPVWFDVMIMTTRCET